MAILAAPTEFGKNESEVFVAGNVFASQGIGITLAIKGTWQKNIDNLNPSKSH